MSYVKNANLTWDKVKDSDLVLILSPYITGPLAQQILEQNQSGQIYTRFELELFASGASDLRAIKRLVEAGHEVLHLPDLHAKVIIARGQIATVGSQNLTRKGLKNLELSHVTRDLQQVDDVRQKVKPWLFQASRVSLEMIEAMSDLLPDLQDLYSRFSEACKPAQHMVNGHLVGKNKLVEKTRTEIVNAIKSAPLALDVTIATVTYLPRSRKYTLKVDSKPFTSWSFNGRDLFTLTRFYRYLCVLDTGRIGWARVVAQRISIIGTRLGFDAGLIQGQAEWEVSIESDGNLPEGCPGEANLLAHVSMGGTELFWVPLKFTLTDCHAFAAKRPLNDSGTGVLGRQARSWFINNKDRFVQCVLKGITEPFQYKANLTGLRAENFFGPERTTYEIRLARVGGHPVLFASSPNL
ncbi:phospholipase D-like domain-containing protein [Pseudomonas sp. OTU5201]|uniref:phospholipase D-like domain-containing protein n=1 Tax=Pseudomonas sp. OTU5201 TaxID=3043850 RepID=UPI00313BFBE1